jgi:hypothetical protein
VFGIHFELSRQNSMRFKSANLTKSDSFMLHTGHLIFLQA